MVLTVGPQATSKAAQQIIQGAGCVVCRSAEVNLTFVRRAAGGLKPQKSAICSSSHLRDPTSPQKKRHRESNSLPLLRDKLSLSAEEKFGSMRVTPRHPGNWTRRKNAVGATERFQLGGWYFVCRQITDTFTNNFHFMVGSFRNILDLFILGDF